MGKKIDYFDGISKIITALVAAAGFVWGIVKFQQEQHYNETHEFRIRLWEQKFASYNKLRDITGNIIVNRNDSTILDSLSNEFDLLYYSYLVMADEKEVEVSLVAFKEALFEYREEIKSEMYLKKRQIQMMREVAESLQKRQKFLLNEE